MAKIRVTENELKQIISESVKQVMKEDKAARWDRRYKKYQDLLNDYNTYYTKENYNLLSADEKQKVDADYQRARQNGSFYENPEQYYNHKRSELITNIERASNKKGVATRTQQASQNAVQQFNTEKEELNNIITNRDARIKQLTGLIQNISNLLSNVTLPKQNIQEDSSQDVATVAPETNVQNIMAKINYLIGQANLVPGLQQNIRNLQVANNELQNRINQSIATAQLNKTQPQAAAIRPTTQAQANPAAQRTVATTAPVTQQGRPTA